MVTACKWAALGSAAGAAILLLSACDNGPSAVARGDGEGPRRLASSAPSEERAVREDRPERAAAQADHRSEPALRVDGEAMWAATRRYSADDGARRSFERNGADFHADSLDAYVRKARDFVSHPPAGVETLERPNGDTLYYDAKANVFAVANKDGLPKTMFKPEEGAAYWREQKDRDARRETARRGGGGDEG